MSEDGDSAGVLSEKWIESNLSLDPPPVEA